MKKVEDIGLTVAEQMKPTSDGYKTITLSSGKVGESQNTEFFLPVICYLPHCKIALFLYTCKILGMGSSRTGKELPIHYVTGPRANLAGLSTRLSATSKTPRAMKTYR